MPDDARYESQLAREVDRRTDDEPPALDRWDLMFEDTD